MAKKPGLIIDVLAAPGRDEDEAPVDEAPVASSDAESLIAGIEAQLAELRRAVADLG